MIFVFKGQSVSFLKRLLFLFNMKSINDNIVKRVSDLLTVVHRKIITVFQVAINARSDLFFVLDYCFHYDNLLMQKILIATAPYF